MPAFLSLVGGIKGIVIILLVVVLGSYAYKLKHDVTVAETARDQAITQRDSAAVERDKAIAAAKTNADTIDQLQQDKADVNFALNTLASAKEKNRTNTVTREIVIQAAASDAANTAVAAPVLGAIITEVQADRDRRRSTN